jgi:hypothetical protein
MRYAGISTNQKPPFGYNAVAMIFMMISSQPMKAAGHWPCRSSHATSCPKMNVTMPQSRNQNTNPTTPLSLALRFSAFTMREIGLVIAPLDPRHKSEALFNRICMQGQHDLE